MPHCPQINCNVMVTSISALNLHLKFVHKIRKDKEHSFRCKEPNCLKTCSNWTEFRKHLNAYHLEPVWKAPSPVPSCGTQSGNESLDQGIALSSESEQSTNSCPIFIDCEKDQPVNVDKSLHDILLRFTAKLYSNPHVSRSLVQDITTSTQNLFQEMVQVITPQLEQVLKKRKVDSDGIAEVNTVISLVEKPFVDLSTEYRRFKAFENAGCLIPSQSYTIGDKIDDKLSNGEIAKVCVEVNAEFIPMREVLQKMFSLPGVFTKTYSYMTKLEKETNVVQNFVQGNMWRRKKQMFFPDKIVFPLFLYFDDFEINNPLGSHKGIHKLGAVYYSVACFPPEVNSQVENIFVGGLFHSHDRCEFRNHRVFNIFIKELNYLQTHGITIQTENGPKQIYFALGLILGDYLGLNSILGFAESFRANYFCRFCKVHRTAIGTTFTETNLRDSYLTDVMLGNVSLTGIKEMSVWEAVLYFKSTKNFAVCFLHDGLEGVLKVLMPLIVHHYTLTFEPADQRLSLNVLNGRLKSFNYQRNGISNRPPLISEDEVREKKFSMSGSEQLNFFLMFSMLVGDLVCHDEVWKLYLLLRQIFDLCLSRKLQKGCGALMKTLVAEFLSLFVEIFPNETVKPKMHNFTHYKTVFEESGPIINLSTSRYESKHKDLKTEANATTSRVNITYTLCLKEQLVLCHRLLTKHGLVPNDDFGPAVCIENISLCDDFHEFANSVPSNFEGPYLKSSWVKANGQTYKKGSCVAMKISGDDELLPEFGLIKTVLINDENEILLVCNDLVTLGFDHEFHAYSLEKTNDMTCVLVKDLASPFLAIYVEFGCGRISATVRHAL